MGFFSEMKKLTRPYDDDDDELPPPATKKEKADASARSIVDTAPIKEELEHKDKKDAEDLSNNENDETKGE